MLCAPRITTTLAPGRSRSGGTAAWLRDHGATPDDADQVATLMVATLMVAAVEGTVALCRAKRSIEPLDRVAVQLKRLVNAVTDRAG